MSAQTTPWGFYGRSTELARLQKILGRKRFFFARITGRRRIGKTSLIQQALGGYREKVLYVQIPDSEEAGVLSAFADAVVIFGVALPRTPKRLAELADAIGELIRGGYIVVLDEFQYFAKKRLAEFPSHLQRVVDELLRDAEKVEGGLFVLGSLFTEMVTLLDDRQAPLYGRTTDTLDLPHLDIASVLEILDTHADRDPERLLTLWNLFEGVPKFYRDAYEQDALRCDRKELLRRMFFNSSAPLRTGAADWFLHELQGRYDAILKYVAHHPGCTSSDINAHLQDVAGLDSKTANQYLKVLEDRFQLIERKLPIFADSKERKGRYYIRDNFLRSWLHALDQQVKAVHFRPLDKLIDISDQRLREAEGAGLERLVATIYEERSRKGLPGFNLTHRVEGYWDRAGTEIDLVAVDDEARVIRFGHCRRTADKLPAALDAYDGHVQRFLSARRTYATYRIEKVAIAPSIPDALAEELRSHGWLAEDLRSLTADLR
ncbi:MAG TPA: ATP-binding protein [Nannocystis sp.]